MRLSLLYRIPERQLAEILDIRDMARAAAYDRDHGLPDRWERAQASLLKWIAGCLGLKKYKLPDERQPQSGEHIRGIFKAAAKAAAKVKTNSGPAAH